MPVLFMEQGEFEFFWCVVVYDMNLEANGLYYADMFSEAALYVWLSQGGEGGSAGEGGNGGYVFGSLASVMGVGNGPAGLEDYQLRGVVGGRPSRRRRLMNGRRRARG